MQLMGVAFSKGCIYFFKGKTDTASIENVRDSSQVLERPNDSCIELILTNLSGVMM